MSLALTTVADGAVISATGLRAYVEQIETYTNEGIAVADIDPSDWVESTHIYGGSFYGSPNPRARFETGQTIYRHTGMDPLRERAFHKYYASANARIDKLTATFCVPESLVQGSSPYYDLLVEASFWCYEFGGANATLDERTDNAATFQMILGGTPKDKTTRKLYCSDAAYAAAPYEGGAIFARHNHHMVTRIAAADVGAGIHRVGVVVDVNSNVNVRHILVGGRTLRAAWYTR